MPKFERAVDQARLAVIDIGSNSVRMIVYDGMHRAAQPIFNEKANCGLGSQAAEPGMLDDKSIARTVTTLVRFCRIARAMDVADIDAFATAAVRDANNRDALLAAIDRACGLKVEVLSGEDEARMAAAGVLASFRNATGVTGDLGGGSLELVALENGRQERHATMPLGVVRLIDATGAKPIAIERVIEAEMSQLAWLDDAKSDVFYVVGGAWRALARTFMNAIDYPLHIVHALPVPCGDMIDFARVIERMDSYDEGLVRGLSRRRVEMLPVAATLMRVVLNHLRPKTVVFSAHGVREGRHFQRLSAAEQARDPLLAACTALAQDTPRFKLTAEDVFDWMSPAFGAETDEQRRWRRAACVVADIGWRHHPDYRPEQVYRRLLLMPAMGLDHEGRAFLAAAGFARHSHHIDHPCLKPSFALLEADRLRAAFLTGAAQRLAYELSGGDPAVLKACSLEREGDDFVVTADDVLPDIMDPIIQRRLNQMSRLVATDVGAVETAAVA